MTIEQKLAYIKRALELGASVRLSFHQIEEKEAAENVITELSQSSEKTYEQWSNTGTNWFQTIDYDNRIDTVVFYREEYLEEDVDLMGGEEHAV